MAFTRNDLCSRALGMLNRLDVDNPPSAGDIQLVNLLIEPTVERLLSLNLIRRDPTTGLSTIDIGTPSNINSGGILPGPFVALARILTRDIANDFGADPDAYEKQAAQGEDTLAKIRFKGTGAPPPAVTGITWTRRQLIYETLMNLGIVSINEPASPDALVRVDQLINRTLADLQSRSIYVAQNTGTIGSLDTGAFLEGEVSALAQVISRPAAISFGQQFIKGQVSEYIQLAGDGEERLRQMRQELEIDEPISFRDY
jgi:hypothetical protein